jgi:hypothetical protein
MKKWPWWWNKARNLVFRGFGFSISSSDIFLRIDLVPKEDVIYSLWRHSRASLGKITILTGALSLLMLGNSAPFVKWMFQDYYRLPHAPVKRSFHFVRIHKWRHGIVNFRYLPVIALLWLKAKGKFCYRLHYGQFHTKRFECVNRLATIKAPYECPPTATFFY